jgi:transcriptional regulator with XRE-family HTH domain
MQGGDNLKGLAALRIKKGLTQSELGEIFGVDNNTISRYEREILRPSLEMLQRLADFFNVSVDELLNGPNPKKLRISIIWTKEDIDMNVLSVEPNEVNFACKPKEIILWGSFPNDYTPEQVAEQVKNEFIAACAGRNMRDVIREKLNEKN